MISKNVSKNALAVAALLLCAAPALAADLPSQKAPPAFLSPVNSSVSTWNGFYAGLNVGGTFGSDAKTTLQAFPAAPGFDPVGALVLSGVVKPDYSGFLGGGQIGYNYQMGHYLLGFEADFQGLANSGRSGFTSGGLASDPRFSYLITGEVRKSLDYLGTARARVGYLVTPTLLLYGTGGLAYGNANLGFSRVGGTFVAATNAILPAGTQLQGASDGVSASSTLFGWAAGAGAEWMFMSNWSAKAEYLYYDLGSMKATAPLLDAPATFAGGAVIGDVTTASTRFDGHIVRAGLNYHF